MAKKIKRDEFSAPDLQECRLIILHVIGQAVKDYELFKGKKKEEEQFIYETARGFLFDEDYTIDWGGIDLTLAQLCTILEMDVNWLRNKIVQKLDIKLLTDGRIVPKKVY